MGKLLKQKILVKISVLGEKCAVEYLSGLGRAIGECWGPIGVDCLGSHASEVNYVTNQPNDQCVQNKKS